MKNRLRAFFVGMLCGFAREMGSVDLGELLSNRAIPLEDIIALKMACEIALRKRRNKFAKIGTLGFIGKPRGPGNAA